MNPSLKTAVITLLWILFSVFGAVTLRIPIIWALVSILFFSVSISIRNGSQTASVIRLALRGIRTVAPVVISLSLIGMLIGLWLTTGILPHLMASSFSILSKANILLTGFLTCTLISMMMGTAIGTLSTAGLVFLGIGSGMHVPLPLLVGALASGAYLGDRTSPLSSGPTLAVTSTEMPIGPILKQYFTSLAPAFFISAALYALIGGRYQATAATLSQLDAMAVTLNGFFHTGPEAWIPPVLLLLMTTLLRQGISRAVIISGAFSFALGLSKGIPAAAMLQSMLFGFHPQEPDISALVHGGGLAAMWTVLMIVIVSGAFNGVLQNTGLLDPLLRQLTQHQGDSRFMLLKSAFLATLVTLITCNQSLTILVTGRQFSTVYDSHQIDRSILSRIIADFGVVIVPLIPWNVNAILVSSLTGITALEYGPWTFLCWTLPAVSLLMVLTRDTAHIKHHGHR